MVAAASCSPKKSLPSFISILTVTSRSLWEWGCHQGLLLTVGDLRIFNELHRWFILRLCFQDRCGLLGLFGDFWLSATNNVRPALGGVAVAARRRHGPEVEDEGHLKDFDVIFNFLMNSTIHYFF
jgi:hypothetical protein